MTGKIKIIEIYNPEHFHVDIIESRITGHRIERTSAGIKINRADYNENDEMLSYEIEDFAYLLLEAVYRMYGKQKTTITIETKHE